MSPQYSGTKSSFPNVENITRLTTSSDYASWLHRGDWWTMGAYDGTSADRNMYGTVVFSLGGGEVMMFSNRGASASAVRPVITIVK